MISSVVEIPGEGRLSQPLPAVLVPGGRSWGVPREPIFSRFDAAPSRYGKYRSRSFGFRGWVCQNVPAAPRWGSGHCRDISGVLQPTRNRPPADRRLQADFLHIQGGFAVARPPELICQHQRNRNKRHCQQRPHQDCQFAFHDLPPPLLIDILSYVFKEPRGGRRHRSGGVIRLERSFVNVIPYLKACQSSILQLWAFQRTVACLLSM